VRVFSISVQVWARGAGPVVLLAPLLYSLKT
jgi:hypothetical protein